VGATFTFQQWGQLGLHGSKVVLIGDLNGDGQSDIAAYQASTRQWFVGISTGDSFTFSPTGSPVTLASWAHPLLADFTGDGVDDIAVYRPFNARWWVDLPSA